MGGLYSHTTRATGTVLTAVIYNGDHQNHIDNLMPSMIDDQSTNVAAMQATTSPGGVGTESLATNLQGEIERLRYVIKTMHGGAQWYPGVAAAILGANTFTGNQTIQSSDDGAGEGPLLTLSRLSTTPADSDLLGALVFAGKDDGGNTTNYAKQGTTLVDNDAAGSDGAIFWQTIIADTLATRMTLGAGLYMAGATGGDPGAGKINATEIQVNGVTIIGPSFRATAAAATTLTASTWVKVPFSTEVFDTNSNYDAATNYRFTPTVAGKYLFYAQAQAQNVTKDNIFRIAIYINGSAVVYDEIVNVTTGGDMELTARVSGVFDMNGSTDYAEVFVWCDDVSPTTLTNSALLTQFSGCKVG